VTGLSALAAMKGCRACGAEGDEPSRWSVAALPPARYAPKASWIIAATRRCSSGMLAGPTGTGIDSSARRIGPCKTCASLSLRLGGAD
jgi:hypothetical protein